MFRQWWVCGVATLALGCGQSDESDAARETKAVCSAGDTRECVGVGACAGGQKCGDDGRWRDCDCGENDDDEAQAEPGPLGEAGVLDPAPGDGGSQAAPPGETAKGPGNGPSSGGVPSGGSAPGGAEMPGSGGVPNGPSSPADMGGGGSAGAGGEALGGGGQGGESAGAPPLDCGPSDTYLAQMCEASAPLLQEGTRCDAYDLNYCFECTNDADCDGVPCSDGVCSSPCSDHSECGDYGICEAPGYCRGIPFCLPLMPPAMSGSYADMPLGEPLVYRSSDLPVWCENGAAAEPGFPVDVEVQLEIRAGGNVLAFPSPPSIYLSVDDGLEDVILGVELVVRWTMDFREDRYESLSYRCAMQSGDCEETSDQEGPLPKLLGDSMIRAGDSGPQELRIRFDQTGDRVLVRYFAVYVESNGKRAYLTKPPAGQVGDPCESPMCPMFLAAEYWDAQ